MEIDLKRGSTLEIEHAAGGRVRLNDGSAWLSARSSSHPMYRGEIVVVRGSDTTLVYALADVSLSVQLPEDCRMQVRRRGEVLPNIG